MGETRTRAEPQFPVVWMVSAFLDLFSVAILLPQLWIFARDLGANHFQTGLLTALYSTLQFLLGPFVGECADIFGRRRLLILSFLVGGLSYSSLGFCTSYTMLALNRIPPGIMKHTQTLTKAHLANSYVDTRSKVMGYFQAASIGGFIFGPVTGSQLMKLFDEPFKVLGILSGTLCFINAAIIYFATDSDDVSTPKTDKNEDNSTLKQLEKVYFDLKNSPVFSLRPPWLWIYSSKLLVNFARNAHRQCMPVILELFGLDHSYVGMAIMVEGGMVVAASPFSEQILGLFQNTTQCIVYFGLLQSVIYFVLPYMPSSLFLFSCLFPLGLIAASTRIAVVDLALEYSDVSHSGLIFGMDSSIMSLARILSPAVTGFLMDYSVYSAELFAAFLSLASVAALWQLKVKAD